MSDVWKKLMSRWKEISTISSQIDPYKQNRILNGFRKNQSIKTITECANIFGHKTK